MKLEINTGDTFVDFLKKASKLGEEAPKICGKLRHLNLIKRQDKRQDMKISNFIHNYLPDRDITDWGFLSERVPDRQYSSASSFFVTHDSKDIPSLFEKIGRVVVPKGLLFVVDYNMNWIRQLLLPQGMEIFEAYFNLGNEIKERNKLIQELNEEGASYCYDLHTRYSLDDYLETIKNAGFQTIQVESIPREKPKIFLYIGERK